MLMLKELRRQAGLSGAKARGDCRISTAYVLCKALGVPLDEFYKEGAGD